ncbi:MAG: hypothetical protein HDT29_00540 [Clostridiales bacterium]|nr:hypothetical protein [Clostridiales bacterium]
MKISNKDEELFEKYYLANKITENNDNRISILNVEKIKLVINNSKNKNINKLTVSIAENKIKKYLNGADQRYVTLGMIRDISILLDIPLNEIFIDGFLQNLCKTNSNI